MFHDVDDDVKLEPKHFHFHFSGKSSNAKRKERKFISENA